MEVVSIKGIVKGVLKGLNVPLGTGSVKKSFLVLPMFVSLFMVFPAASEVNAGKYESPGNRKVSEILPPEKISGPHYRILEKVVSYGYMHHYTVKSDFGDFEVTGDGALRKLLKEIKAIAALTEITQSDAFLESVKGAATKPVDFGKNLITDPVNTVSGIPKGVFGLFSNIATSITEKHDPSEDARAEQVLLLSSYKREYAYKLGVDVYSSNPVLQKELNKVGWAGAVGSLGMSVATAPIGGAAVATFKTMRMANQINEVLKEEPPPRLRIINEEKLSAMGVSEKLRKKDKSKQGRGR